MNVRQALTFALVMALITAGGFTASATKGSEPVSQPTISSREVNEQWMLEGEKRYRMNCGRCHQPPHRFPPREMAMAVRHMRVRAMLTEDDMKFLIYYLTH